MYNCLKVLIFPLMFPLWEDNLKTPSCYLVVFSDAQPIQFWLSECDTYNQHVSEGVFYKCFCQPWNCDDPIISQFITTPEEEDAYTLVARDESSTEIFSLPFEAQSTSPEPSRIAYNAAFTPSESSPELCDVKVTFHVLNSSDVEVAKSDCQHISTHQNTLLINYYNHQNYAGLIYGNGQKFNIRVPAFLFHQRFPDEEEVMELTSSLVTANSSMRKQKLLDTDYLPYYFHEKLILALKHQFVTIYNKQWVKQEPYEVVGGDSKQPWRRGACWLSEKDFLQRNVL